MKIISTNNCDNSPKNNFIETYSIHLLTKNLKELQLTSASSISIILPGGLEIDNLIDLKKWDLEVDTVLPVAAASHGKQAFFLALLTQENKERYLTIYYEFKTFKADKINKVIVFEGDMVNRIS
ncbi:hypothetical protein HCJ52_14150 [Listeria sp. FSL L7-1485]|uniref:Uncharacterized protein n=1 Tax=Listeria immobilis TaxID=2713502 RepID=A0A7X0X9M2_9LIST|nr:hypothetical protein [Listeria immobilis]MBC1490164.1 hypothetical protein [Listeria immobilis]MBC1537255.1 hypothetical protein [Listeria immobilis]